jgi:hypothetical protein
MGPKTQNGNFLEKSSNYFDQMLVIYGDNLPPKNA